MLWNTLPGIIKSDNNGRQFKKELEIGRGSRVVAQSVDKHCK